ncbi:hypothetical protein C8R47DRAFT_1064568 [Mycena vitilis]|nr:hypothetical protein C8R47DRAFT_1064568 [Mycena vitilis]
MAPPVFFWAPSHFKIVALRFFDITVSLKSWATLNVDAPTGVTSQSVVQWQLASAPATRYIIVGTLPGLKYVWLLCGIVGQFTYGNEDRREKQRTSLDFHAVCHNN